MVFTLVILTFAIVILIGLIIDKVLRRSARRVDQKIAAAPVLTAEDQKPAPGGIFLHPGHTWAFLEFTGDAKIGIDDFAQKVIGTIDGIEHPMVGGAVRQGERILTLVQGNRRIDLVSPLDGFITHVNQVVASDPAMMKSDPYVKGWILSIKPTNIFQNIKMLKIADEASHWLGSEMKRFTEFVLHNMHSPQEAGVTVHDGGESISGIVERMDGNMLELFIKKFLS